VRENVCEIFENVGGFVCREIFRGGVILHGEMPEGCPGKNYLGCSIASSSCDMGHPGEHTDTHIDTYTHSPVINYKLGQLS